MPKVKKKPSGFTLQEVKEILQEVDEVIDFYNRIIDKANQTPKADNLEAVLGEAVSVASAKAELERVRRVAE